MENNSNNKKLYAYKDIFRDILKDTFFSVSFNGIPIKTATHDAFIELEKFGLDFFDVKEVLENGFDCARSKRKEEIVEKCIRRGKKKILKVVVEKMTSCSGKEYWRIRHVGMFSFKKKRFK